MSYALPMTISINNSCDVKKFVGKNKKTVDSC